jgi:hypothetical protein
MKKAIIAAALAACLAVPAYPQSATQTAAQPAVAQSTVVADAEVAPIPVPQDAPAGSSGPGAVSMGVGAGVLVVVLGIVLLSSMAFMGPA